MKTVLELHELKKIYKGGNVALKGISLQIQQGDCFALLGPNGAGKSTTIGIICSLINKTSGKVSILGHDLDSHSTKIKQHLGLVPQEFNANRFEQVEHILLTQAGYFGIPKGEAQANVDYYLEILDLKDKRNVQAGALSGGMKRRLMIARAMIHDPDIIILDEPTAGVDVELRYSLWKLVKSINSNGKTIILTTHYLEEAERLCNKVAIIHNGKIAYKGSMRNLLESSANEKLLLTSINKIEQLPQANGYKIKKLNDNSLEVTIDANVGLNGLFKLLDQANIQIMSISNASNKLEQLYMRITNQKQVHSS
jgi:ABC-2 type transport system ATP-binding protein